MKAIGAEYQATETEFPVNRLIASDGKIKKLEGVLPSMDFTLICSNNIREKACTKAKAILKPQFHIELLYRIAT